jgi:hypothetical protein
MSQFEKPTTAKKAGLPETDPERPLNHRPGTMSAHSCAPWRDPSVSLQVALVVGVFLGYVLAFNGDVRFALQFTTGLPAAQTARGAIGLLLVVSVATLFWRVLFCEVLAAWSAYRYALAVLLTAALSLSVTEGLGELVTFGISNVQSFREASSGPFAAFARSFVGLPWLEGGRSGSPVFAHELGVAVRQGLVKVLLAVLILGFLVRGGYGGWRSLVVPAFGAAGLGFGVGESFVHFAVQESAMRPLSFYVVRALFCTPFHALFGVMTGWAIAELWPRVQSVFWRVSLLLGVPVVAMVLCYSVNSCVSDVYPLVVFINLLSFAMFLSTEAKSDEWGWGPPAMRAARDVLAILRAAGRSGLGFGGARQSRTRPPPTTLAMEMNRPPTASGRERPDH